MAKGNLALVILFFFSHWCVLFIMMHFFSLLYYGYILLPFLEYDFILGTLLKVQYLGSYLNLNKTFQSTYYLHVKMYWHVDTLACLIQRVRQDSNLGLVLPSLWFFKQI